MVAWPANVLAALAFGLMHLPQLAQFGAATPAAIAGTMLGNGIVGVFCGWLYWRRSLVAAILAHFAVDLILHVLPAIGT
jgi:membrane protease YdiL (CAAX protease family)